MDEAVVRGLKFVVLLGMAGLFLAAGIWAYLFQGLILGLAGPVFAVFLAFYVVNDVYTDVFAG